MNDKYRDIIDLPHHQSERRPRMPIEHRAAQFSSFAALTGHEENIAETARITSEMIELTQEQKNNLSRILEHIIRTGRRARIVFFQPDMKKRGGEYKVVIDSVRRLEEGDKTLHLKSGMTLPLEKIVGIKEIVKKDQFTSQKLQKEEGRDEPV